MRTIYKLAFPVATEHGFRLPKGAIPLKVGQDTRDPEKIGVWFFVDDEQPEVGRRIHIVGTGRPIPDAIQPGDYLGSCLMGYYIWHVFAEPEA